jgi:hypothetical protein
MDENLALQPGPEEEDDAAVSIKRFSSEEMIGCGACKRPNPPNRLKCLYCGVPLPDDQLAAKLQRPSLRRLAEMEAGVNIVVLNRGNAELSPDAAPAISELLRLPLQLAEAILSLEIPSPLVRVPQDVEAAVTIDRLAEVGVEAIGVSDLALGFLKFPPRRANKLELGASTLGVHFSGGAEGIESPWEGLRLIVTGRLRASRVELEQRAKRSDENEVTNSSETNADEAVFDIFMEGTTEAIRISAAGFDFSCLKGLMGLTTATNFVTLTDELMKRAPHCRLDNTFSRQRRIVDGVWPTEQKHEAGRIRRLAPGRYRTEAVLTRNNETQFTRYSYLTYYLSRLASNETKE